MWHILGVHEMTESVADYNIQFPNSMNMYKHIRVIFYNLNHVAAGDYQINLKPARELYGELRSNAGAGYGFAIRVDDNSSTATNADAVNADPGLTQYGLAWSIRGTAGVANNYTCGILDFYNGGATHHPYAQWSFYNTITSTNYNRYSTGGSYQNISDGSFNGFGFNVHSNSANLDGTLGAKFIILGMPRNDFNHKMEHVLPHKNRDGDN